MPLTFSADQLILAYCGLFSAAVGVIWGVVVSIWIRPTRWRWAAVASPAIVLALAVVVRDPLFAAVTASCGLLGGLGSCLGGSAVVGRVLASTAGRRGLAATFAGLLVVTACWVEAQTQSLHDLDVEHVILAGPPLIVDEQVKLVSDRGRPITAYLPTAGRRPDEWVALERKILSKDHAFTAIRTQQQSVASNCFGWVFTGGKNWLDTVGVEVILEDNDYTPVSSPRPGDLAVYRQSQRIIHVAIVRYVSGNRSPLVEGKWGVGAVYLHELPGGIYSGAVTWYRSSRSSHLVEDANRPTSSR